MDVSFGARLRSQRERQQVSLAVIAERTKIKVSLLEGLERDETIRPTSTLEGMASLKPVREGGKITAGVASQNCDGAAALLMRWSAEHERSADPQMLVRQRRVSGPGLVVIGLTVTFASIDWIMSLEAHWYSTIYGIHFFGGHVLAAFAFSILLAAHLAGRTPFAGALQPGQFIDLGNLLLAFVMLWAYFAYSQWIVIWSGNLPEEISWYLRRNRGGWQ